MIDTARARRWQAGLALLLLALGIALAVGTALLPVPVTYARVGPRLFPGLVAGGTCLAGAALLYGALRTGSKDTADIPAIDWYPLAAASAGLILHLLLIERAGFIIASTVLYVAVAFSFGSRRLPRDTLVGLVLAGLAYVGFTRGLGLGLPAGVLPF